MSEEYCVYTGGADGADKVWTQKFICLEYKVHVMSFAGHKRTLPQDPNKLIQITEFSKEDLNNNNEVLQEVCKRLKRSIDFNNSYVSSLIQRNVEIVRNSDVVFAVGFMDKDFNIDGGTAWGCEVAKLWNKPLVFFDMNKEKWYKYNGDGIWGLVTSQFSVYDYDGYNLGVIGSRGINARGIMEIENVCHSDQRILEVRKIDFLRQLPSMIDKLKDSKSWDEEKEKIVKRVKGELGYLLDHIAEIDQ